MKNNFLKLAKRLLYPNAIIMLLLLPVSIVLLVFSFTLFDTSSPLAIVSYVISAYTLTVFCVRMPMIITAIKAFKSENKYAVLWFSDERLRVKATTLLSLALNIAFALFQLGLGVIHGSFWFYSLSVYYVMLAVMRACLMLYMKENKILGNIRAEVVRYRICAIIFLLMNLALTLIVFFMVYWGRTFEHHEITVIAMAAYTFTSFFLAIRSIVKYKKYNSPIYSAAKAISLASACVSILTLESSMLTAFGTDTMDAFTKKLFLSLTGGAVSAFIIAMAIYMIVKSTRQLREIKYGAPSEDVPQDLNESAKEKNDYE